MYSNRNFEIREEYVDPDEIQFMPPEFSWEALGQGIAWVFGFVAILFAAGIVVAIVGWIWSFTQVNPPTQPQAQRSQQEHLQEERRSPARPIGGERSGNPQASGRTQQHRNLPAGTEASPQNQVVQPIEERRASVPVFHWVCLQGSLQCEVQDSTGNSIQKYWLANGSINSSAIQSSYGRLPPAWGCAVSGQKLQCDF